MDISEFTEESIKQIVTAINNLNAGDNGIIIPNSGIIGEGVQFIADNKGKTKNLIKVEFDVAVVVTEQKEISGNGGANISIIKLGIDSNNSIQSQNVSRIKYMIPVKWTNKFKSIK